MEEKHRGGSLAVAVLWTVATAMWIIITAYRLQTGYGGGGLRILTLATMLVTGAACVVNWRRYIKRKKNDTTKS